jgi:hypothetical protein
VTRPQVVMSAAARRHKNRQSRWLGLCYLTLLCVFLFFAVFHDDFYRWWGLVVMAAIFAVAVYCYVRSRGALRDFLASIAVDSERQGISRRL